MRDLASPLRGPLATFAPVIAILAVIVCFAACWPAYASTLAWKTTPQNGNWGDAGNWDDLTGDDVDDIPDGTDLVIFPAGGSLITTIVIDTSDRIVDAIDIQGANWTFTVANTLTIDNERTIDGTTNVALHIDTGAIVTFNIASSALVQCEDAIGILLIKGTMTNSGAGYLAPVRVTLSGGTWNCNSNVEQAGILALTTGSFIGDAVTTRTFEVAGNVFVAGGLTAFTPNKVDFNLDRSSAQTLTIPSGKAFNNLTVSGGSSVTLQSGSNLEVNGDLVVNGDALDVNTPDTADATVTVGGNATFVNSGVFIGSDVGKYFEMTATSAGLATPNVAILTPPVGFTQFKVTSNTVKLAGTLTITRDDNGTDLDVTGVLDPDGNAIALAGDLVIDTTGSFTGTLGTFTFNKPGGGGNAQDWSDLNVTTGPSSIGHVTVQNANNTVVVLSAVKAQSIDIQGGVLDPNANSIMLVGKSAGGFVWKNAAAFTPDDNQVVVIDLPAVASPATILSGSASDFTTPNRDFEDLTINGGTVNVTTNPLDLSGHLIVAKSATADSNPMLDLGTRARFNDGSGESVVVGGTGTPGTIQSSTASLIIEFLQGFTANSQGVLTFSGASSQLTFGAGTTTNVEIGSQLLIDAGGEITLRSSADGVQWMIRDRTVTAANFGGTGPYGSNPVLVNVRDSNALLDLGGREILPLFPIDSGNNTNWIFEFFIINDATLPNGTVATAYSEALLASGGSLPYTWSVVAGSLPPGLALTTDGLLQGTPESAGTFDFTAQVNDTFGRVATKAFELVIDPGSVSAPEPSARVLVAGISAAWPNPFGQQVRLEYAVPIEAHVEVTIHAVDGRRVRSLVRGIHRPDIYGTVWDGRDDHGVGVASGIYHVVMSGPGGRHSRRIVRLLN